MILVTLHIDDDDDDKGGGGEVESTIKVKYASGITDDRVLMEN